MKVEELKNLYGISSLGQKIILAAIDPSALISRNLVKDNITEVLEIIKNYKQEAQFFNNSYASSRNDLSITLALDKLSPMFSEDENLHQAQKETREKNVAIFCDVLSEYCENVSEKNKPPIDKPLIYAFLMQMSLASGDHKRFKKLLDKSPESAWAYGFHRSASAASIALMNAPASDMDSPAKKEYIDNLNKCGAYVVEAEAKSKLHHPSVYFTSFVSNPKTYDDEQFNLLQNNDTLDKYAQDIGKNCRHFSDYMTMMEAAYASLTPNDEVNISKFHKRKRWLSDKVMNLIPQDYVVEEDDAIALLDKVSLNNKKFDNILSDIDRVKLMLGQPAIMNSSGFEEEKELALKVVSEHKDELLKYIIASKNKLDAKTKITFLKAIHFNSFAGTSEAIIQSVKSDISNLEKLSHFTKDLEKSSVQPDELIKPEEKDSFAAGFSKAVIHGAGVKFGRGNILNTKANDENYVKTRSYLKFTKDMMYKTASNFLSVFGVNRNSRESAKEVAAYSEEIKKVLNVGVQVGM